MFIVVFYGVVVLRVKGVYCRVLRSCSIKSLVLYMYLASSPYKVGMLLY